MGFFAELATRQERRWVICGLALFLLLAIATILTKGPWWDEGVYAGPAHNLAQGGRLGAHSLSTAAYERGDEFVYWSLPLYFVSLAGWFKIFGFSIFTMRAFSVCWGIALLLAWLALISRLSHSRLAVTIFFVLLSCDAEVVAAATNGRMDTMTAALGYGSIAVFVWFRERNFWAAVLGGSSLAAAAVFTHPLGIIYVASFAITAL